NNTQCSGVILRYTCSPSSKWSVGERRTTKVFTPPHGETDAFDRRDIVIVDHEVIDFNVMLAGMFYHTLLGFPGSRSSCDHLPGQRLPGVHGNDGTVALWYHPGRFFKLDDACGWLNAIDALRVVGYKGLQPVQNVMLLEQLDQTR